MASAIPTEYAGIRMRSRLEAQWAAFFDLIGWRWQYEPIDLAGYIPDFIIDAKEQILVEVKPVMKVQEFHEHAAKIIGSGWRGPYFVVGSSFIPRAEIIDDPEVSGMALGCGYLDSCEYYELANKEIMVHRGLNVSSLSPWTVEARDPHEVLIEFCSRCNRFYPCDGPPFCRLCGGSWEIGDRKTDDGVVESAFISAKNRVQWKGSFGA